MHHRHHLSVKTWLVQLSNERSHFILMQAQRKKNQICLYNVHYSGKKLWISKQQEGPDSAKKRLTSEMDYSTFSALVIQENLSSLWDSFSCINLCTDPTHSRICQPEQADERFFVSQILKSPLLLQEVDEALWTARHGQGKAAFIF